jgi:hypothetical protein
MGGTFVKHNYMNYTTHLIRIVLPIIPLTTIANAINRKIKQPASGDNDVRFSPPK